MNSIDRRLGRLRAKLAEIVDDECETTPIAIGTRVRWRTDLQEFGRMYARRCGEGIVFGHCYRPTWRDKYRDFVIPGNFLLSVEFENGEKHDVAADWLEMLPLERSRSLTRIS